MRANASQLDRVIRALLGGGLVGSALGVFGLASGRPSGTILAALGAELLVSGVVGFSILYALLGLKTCDEC
jgi:hypothetical protein